MDVQNIPYISLSDLVDEYCMAAENDRRKYVANYLVHGRRIWKDLFWKTLYQVVSTYVKVKSDESGRYYVDVPANSVRVISLGRVDRYGRVIPFISDEQINPLVASFQNGVICPECGEDQGLSSCANDLMVSTKEIIIQGTSYVEKIWKKVDADGSLLQIREVPTLDYTNPLDIKVTTVTLSNKVCSLDINPCGCIRHTPHNQAMVQLYCGLGSVTARAAICQDKDWAGIKVAGNRIYFSFKGRVPDFAQLIYQTNGECSGQEIMIPEYAVDCVTFGVHWRAGALAPAGSVGPNEKRERKRDYDLQREELERFLNPIIPQDFLASQMSIAKWGGLNIEPKERICLDKRVDIQDPRDLLALSEADILDLIDSKLAGLSQGGLQGPKGEKGDPGPFAAQLLEFHFSQDTPATIWDITHNLGYKPNIDCENKQGVPLWGWSFNHVSDNRVVITHGIAVAGDAYLS